MLYRYKRANDRAAFFEERQRIIESIRRLDNIVTSSFSFTYLHSVSLHILSFIPPFVTRQWNIFLLTCISSLKYAQPLNSVEKEERTFLSNAWVLLLLTILLFFLNSRPRKIKCVDDNTTETSNTSIIVELVEYRIVMA